MPARALQSCVILVAVLGAAVLAIRPACGADAAASAVQTFTLDNGLSVILRPAAEGTHIALITLFDIGELQDPPGRSGLGHLLEHVYITAAAGAAPARTADEWFARYAMQANAQTGAAYTVFATVFPAGQLDAELAEASARMRELRLEQADLDREKPRVNSELDNMYDRMPALAAMNRARAAADPLPPGARRGGAQHEVDRITLDELRDHHRRFYKPVNATVVIVGGFDASALAAKVKELYGSIDKGEPAPLAAATPPPRLGEVDAVEVPDAGMAANVRAVATIAYRAPPPESDVYPAFLCLAARLQQRSMPTLPSKGVMRVMPMTFALLDDPRVLFISAELQEGQSNEEAVAALCNRVAGAVTIGEGERFGASAVMAVYGPMLGLMPLPDAMIAQNPYMTAFTLGRMKQMKLDPAGLKARLEAITPEQLKQAAAEIFAPERGAAVVLRVR